MRISDWSSDVCSSDLSQDQDDHRLGAARRQPQGDVRPRPRLPARAVQTLKPSPCTGRKWEVVDSRPPSAVFWNKQRTMARSEEHTSELQSLMRISYAVFCLKKKKDE